MKQQETGEEIPVGSLPIAKYTAGEYQDRNKQFKFQSFLPRTEIIEALVKVSEFSQKFPQISQSFH